MLVLTRCHVTDINHVLTPCHVIEINYVDRGVAARTPLQLQSSEAFKYYQYYCNLLTDLVSLCAYYSLTTDSRHDLRLTFLDFWACWLGGGSVALQPCLQPRLHVFRNNLKANILLRSSIEVSCSNISQLPRRASLFPTKSSLWNLYTITMSWPANDSA